MFDFADRMLLLVRDLAERLAKGEILTNPRLRALADKAFGGSRAKGTYTSRDAYDAQETALHTYLHETGASLLKLDMEAFSLLEQLSARLATQTDRTVEQIEL